MSAPAVRETSRLAPGPAEVIDRETTITFTFNGRSYTAHPGDTIASALAASGVQVFSRSFKYHRPRGLLCCAGHCPNCLVEVGDEPNVRACTRPAEADLDVRPQNAWPSLDRDVMALTALGDRFLPVGFYYKTFIRPQSLWPLFEKVLRRAAGLGQVQPDSRTADDLFKSYLHGDVVVVGGGPAGLSAALAAGQSGARVLLFDDNPTLGGHLRFAGGEGPATAAHLRDQLAALPNVTVFADTTVLGWWEENWLAAVGDDHLYKIRAASVIYATGAYEQPLLFDGNDLPGIMLGSAVRRLLALYGVAPGRQAVVITANDDGWETAAALQEAGLAVRAVVDERPSASSPLADQVVAAGAQAYWSYTIAAAEGGRAVQRACIAPVDERGQVNRESEVGLDCDLIAVSVGWAPAGGLLYQANGRLAFDEERGEFLPVTLPEGVFAVGRLTGTHDPEIELAEGRLAALRAAAYVGSGSSLPAEELTRSETEIAARKAAEPRRTSTLVHVPGKKKQFLCYCEDVTHKDLATSIAEGYNSLELLKRYSTISMGPCQGKMCSQNAIHLCARATNRTIEATGTTTARPPMTPVKLSALAGQNMEPVRYTPLHHWHVARGAKMMVAGLWLRPEHYGEPKAEIQAVRQAAGLIDVSTLGKLRFTGHGVPDLLDRIYVNKWQKLAPGRVRYGVMCNDEGIVLDDGVTARLGQEEYYTTTTSSGAAAIYEWIQWWLQSGWGEGVHLANVTEINAAFNLAGPRARDVLGKLTEADISPAAFPYMHGRQLTVAGVPCLVLRIGFTGELSYEIHCPASFGQHLWTALVEAGEEFGLLPFGLEAQRVLRLEKAHIIVGQDTDALSDPIAADMAWAVKLDKDDFLGQRPLARVAADGPPQKLVGFKMAQPGVLPEEGLQIVQSDPTAPLGLAIIGWVTSSRYSPTLGEAIGLCWLPVELADQVGAPFTIRQNGRLLEAHVHHGPFYDPAGERLRM